MKAVIYSRISRDEQSKYSISEQVQICQKEMEAAGHEIVDIFIDEGFSSKTMKRPALQKMLSQIGQKKFDIICVWNSDRLTRTTLDGLTMVTTMFRPAGIDFVSVTEDIDTSTSDGMMMFTIRLSMAQRERERIAERVIMGQIGRAKKGKRNSSSRPYGYDVGEDLALFINEREAEVVRKIYAWYIKGHGKNKIAGMLNEESIPTLEGSFWRERTIGDVLRNITYTGSTHFKPKNSERIVIEHVHEAIISMETFEKAQAVTARKQEETMSQSSYDFPFSTILKCAVCGRSFHGKKSSRGVRFYRCSGKYRQDPCFVSDIAENKLVNMLFDLSKLDLEESNTFAKEAPEKDVSKERKKIEKKLEESSNRRRNWSYAMGDGKMRYEDFSRLMDEENKRVAEWEKQLTELGNSEEKKAPVRSRKEFARQIGDIKINWSKWDHEERKEVIQNLFKRIAIAKVQGEWFIVGYEEL
jgi:site-specific DNA recombinase